MRPGDKLVNKIIMIGGFMQQYITHVSFGYDSHAFCNTKDTLVLGGCRINHIGLKGVSDADVLIHAVVDAILSGVLRKSIGEVFRDDDPENYNRNSMEFLHYCRDLLTQNNTSIVNIDCTIICETPKISQYSHEMCKNISNALDIETSKVFVKGKTRDGLDNIDCIICYSVVGLCKK